MVFDYIRKEIMAKPFKNGKKMEKFRDKRKRKGEQIKY